MEYPSIANKKTEESLQDAVKIRSRPRPRKTSKRPRANKMYKTYKIVRVL
jgi:hypothetical protein